MEIQTQTTFGTTGLRFHTVKMKAKATNIAKINARVFRVSTGKWEDLGVIFKKGRIRSLINKIKKWQRL